MSRFALVVAIFMLCCPAVFSQHGGGGGGSSGGSFGGGSSSSSYGGGSSSSGGGSHGGYSGGSSSSSSGSSGSHGSGGGSSGGGHTSGGGHGSSGGHGYAGSPSHVAGGSGSSTGGFVSRSVAEMIRSGGVHVVEIQAVTDGNVRVVLDRQSTRQVEEMVKARNSERQIQDFIRERAHANLNPFAPKTEIREHRSFLGLLRHPFRKAEAVELRHRICLSGPCVVCPVGQAHRVGGGCGGASDIAQVSQVCSPFARGGNCSPGTSFPDDCSALRQALQQQAQRLHDSESAQQSACTTGPSQACSDSANAAQNEGSRYRALQDQYRMCRQRAVSTSPFSGRAPGASSQVLR